MVKLTPRDIQEKEFSNAFRGYKEEEVDAFLDEVTESFEALFKENLDLKEEVEKLREACKKYETIGERMQGALIAAQETADEVKKNAEKEAENILREAEIKAQKMIQETRDQHRELQKSLAMLKQIEEEFRFKLKSTLQSYLKLIDELTFGEREEVKKLILPEDLKAVEAEAKVATKEEGRKESRAKAAKPKAESKAKEKGEEAKTTKETAKKSEKEEKASKEKKEETPEEAVEEELIKEDETFWQD